MTGILRNINESQSAQATRIISVQDINVGFDDKLILENLNLDVDRGEILGVVGASGAGKSVLLRTILGLAKRRSGSMTVFGMDYDRQSRSQLRGIERRWGVLFQHGALYSSLNVIQNIQVPMREHLNLPQSLMNELAMLKIQLVGLHPDAAYKMPSELSGGMIKRAALARALSLDPELLFLDEPTSGLDPIGAADFDALILKLRDTLGLTVFMVSHDLDSLFSICSNIAALADKKILAKGTLDDMRRLDHPWVQAYFFGTRARRLIAGDL